MSDLPSTDPIATIRTSAADMERNADFKVVFEEFPAMAGDDINDWECLLRQELQNPHYVIPKDLKRLYGTTGGFRFQWQYSGSGPGALGSSNIVGLAELYQGDEEVDRPISALLEEDRRFDVIGEKEHVSLTFDVSSPDRIQLIWVDEEQKRRDKLKLDPIAYVNMLAKYRAISGWQVMFLESATLDAVRIRTLESDVERLFAAASGMEKM